MTIIVAPMTPRRWALLKAIAEHIDAHSYAPSIRELQALCGISSTSVVSYNLDGLEDAGFISRYRKPVDPERRTTRGVERSVCLTKLGREALRRGECGVKGGGNDRITGRRAPRIRNAGSP